MNIYAQILSMCVAKDALRESLQHPCERNGSMYATNGHLICKVDASLVINRFPRSVQKLIDEAISNGKQNHGRFALADALAVIALFEKHDVFEMIQCAKCKGDGCAKCHYEGERETSKVIGKAFALGASIRIGKNLYSAEYTEWLTEFAKLQNETEIVMVAQPEESKAMGTLFKIGKVEILLMPLRSDGVECSHEIGLSK